MMKQVQLSHGGGGEEMNRLIHDLFYKSFDNDILSSAEDAAVLKPKGAVAFTTDSFTVSPIFFKGGDIGKLAVAGTVNDLAMMGAKPLWLSSAFMIEEGLPFEELEQIVQSMAKELQKSGAKVVCGDTKVVPKGSVDKIFINTSGIGEVLVNGISAHNLEVGDAIIVSRDIGRHGAAIMMAREGIDLESDLKSDCETLWPAVEALIDAKVKIKAMRDATRGGLAAVLNEWAEASNICIEVEEEQLPVCDEVRGICEMLGFEPYDLANEGTFILAVDSADKEVALEALSKYSFCTDASVIGSVTDKKQGKVILQSSWGSNRFLELPKGELLPRIC
ncbi:hydrogenase expression/formation protein HypE [Hydrogenimonas thermophila]|uniref:hydrogenase expression/formation protein HypE n=1 Tax=Hydrogenimonas thermophila TaxID=223786 RepID=UPI002936E2D7|nr:hydrogenase expression/formation protein HypE [Hydrogenimonas thermophila]WOE71224.1 hydrogenase expression/formation protein HypE [Hydrogenimonas thermophila]WOE73744.1 hydrogenase expression/formation protein HypE [Hydrogenimonas thermophila]